MNCICTPCRSPQWGAAGVAHCAACCAGSGIEEYDPACLVGDHAEMARKQWRIDVAEQASDHNDTLRGDAHRSLVGDPHAIWPEVPTPGELAEGEAEWRRAAREERASSVARGDGS